MWGRTTILEDTTDPDEPAKQTPRVATISVVLTHIISTRVTTARPRSHRILIATLGMCVITSFVDEEETNGQRRKVDAGPQIS